MGKKLKVGINGRPFCQSGMRGLSRHTFELIEGIHRLDPEVEFYVYTYGKIDQLYREILPFVTWRESHPPVKCLWDLFILPKQLKKDGIEVFHSTNNLGLPRSKNLKRIITIHDDITHVDRMTRPFSHLWNTVNYLIELWLLKKADEFITISEEAKKSIAASMNIPPAKLRVIYNGITHHPAVTSERKNFYLYVGGLEERKNIPFLLDELALAQKTAGKTLELHLVSAKKTMAPGTADKIKRSTLKISIKENLSEKDLLEEYRGCKAMINASLREGFGLPVAEAMNAKAPLIISDLDVYREVSDNKAFFFDPKTPGTLSEVVTQVEARDLDLTIYREENYQRSLLFSWVRMARETLEIYRR